MVNYIWLFMLISGVIAAAMQGQMDIVTAAALKGAKEGVAVCFGLISILVFWQGMMRIAQHAGLLDKLARVLAPAARLLFPDVPKDHPALGYIVSNMSANLFGLGNAATPMGIKAMEELQKLNPDPKSATPAMCTLLALNTSSLTLIPTTMIGLRMEYGSVQPEVIIGTTIFATCCSTLTAIVLDRWYRRRLNA
ncbi:nucleoside recognition protein [Marinithermofilum abyssi]|uniref:Nucleoside recognition protein n=1 Tax=Marinithermofilum abyssi TaxID=1571185 RepID=A0A8J2YDI9_9BACL|nr:nucleoside recognition domain-containing protein [Marinithermofilum abyssi]GGE10979.1 nucleoside recognition protein [Marinithermofilum abyssi]